MATIKENGQSYLEQEGIDARKVQMARSDYNQNNEYSEQHTDALSDGDEKGKGSGNFGGHGWVVPNMSVPISQNTPQFNTTQGGNDCDNAARTVMQSRSLYGEGREYGFDYVVNTQLNKNEGQFDNADRKKLPYACPVM